MGELARGGAGELGEIFTSSDSERAWCGDGEKFRHCFSYITGGAGKGADLRKYFLDCKPNILKMKLIHLRHLYFYKTLLNRNIELRN